MTKYREILSLRSLGFSERNIANSCNVSRNTVAKVTVRADELRICWPLDFGMTDSALEAIMFPKEKSSTNKRMPDYDYIRKKLFRNGVNKKLLWVEYCEECRMNGEEPLAHSIANQSGISKYVAVKTLWQMPLWIVFPMTRIRSILRVLIQAKTSQ